MKIKDKPVKKSRKKRVKALETKEEVLEQLAVLKAAKVKALSGIADYEGTHRWEYHKPFRWQETLSATLRKKMIVLATSPNGIGKTAQMACIVSSWCEGYEAWAEVDVDYPGAVKVKKEGDVVYCKPSSLGIVPPVRIRVTGEDWNHHLGQVVVPEMKKWFSVDNWHTKKNTSGVDYLWTHKKNGSTIELMTHDQDLKVFEAWRGHGWCADEPPKYDIFKAMARGLAENRGKMLFATTPLREAWMLDELVLKNRSDVGVLKDLTLLDNEISYGNDDRILTELGLGGKNTRYCREADGQKRHFFDLLLYKDDLGVAGEKYLFENVKEGVVDVDSKVMDLIFLKKTKDTSLDEKPSRFFGMFKKLVGLVVKEFVKDKHIVESFVVPVNWVVSFQIDFHLSRPQAVIFFACDERNRHFVIDEVWKNMDASEIADLIIRKKKLDGWNIEYGEIDPLSKGDDKYIKNRDADAIDSFTILSDLLYEEGIELGVASKDKKSGFKNIKSMLVGPSKIPVLYFLDSLQSVCNDAYGIVYEIQRLCYTDKGDIEKENDHFMECLYRYTLMNVQYKDEEEPVYSGMGSAENTSWAG